MIPSVCESKNSNKFVRVPKEKGRVAVFENNNRIEHNIVTYDGCCGEVGKLSADFLVSADGIGNVVVELKGGDVGHAIKQVHETAESCLARKFLSKPIHGLIVARHCPLTTTILQRAKDRLRQISDGKLTVVSGEVRRPLSDFV